MAAARLIARKGRSRSRYREKWERNSVDGICGVRALRYVTPAEGVAGLGVRILAERDRLLREARQSGCWRGARCGERHDGLRLRNGLGGG